MSKFVLFIKKYVNNFSIMLFLIIFAGIFIRIKLFLSAPSMWIDECALVDNIIKTDYLDFFKPLKYNFQVAPPLFLVIEKFCYQVTSIFTQDLKILDMALRIFPLFCGCLCIPLFSYTVYKIFKSECYTLIATTIFLFNSALIYYSVEIKQYSVELFISVIFLSLFNNINSLKQKPKLMNIKIFICVCSIWFSSTAIIYLFLFSVLYFICCYKMNILKKFYKYLCFVLINVGFYLYVYLIPNLFNSISQHILLFWEEIGKIFTIKNFFCSYSYTNVEMFLEPTCMFEYISYIYMFFYPVLFILLTLFFKYVNKEKLYWLYCFVIIPSIIFVILSFLKIYPYVDRLIICLFPGFVIILCIPFLFIKNKYFKMTLTYFLVFLITIFNITKDVKSFNRNPSPIRNLAEILKRNNPSGSNIIAYPDELYCYCSDAKISYDLLEFYKKTKSNTLDIKGDFYIIKSIIRLLDNDENNVDLKFLENNFEILDYIEMENSQLFYAKIRIK